MLGITLLAGALFSYTVELLQFYIPMRDSGWGDVITNSTGSVLGLSSMSSAAPTVLQLASHVESAFVTWLDWRRVIVGSALLRGRVALRLDSPSKEKFA